MRCPALPTLLVATLCLAIVPAQSPSVAFGLKSCGSSPGVCGNVASTNPAVLFSFIPAGSAVPTLRGTLARAGNPIDVDGLAQSATHGLLGFELTSNASGIVIASTLVSIDPNTAAATLIGSALPIEIRGAAFDDQDRLWVCEVVSNRILEIDPATGIVLSPGFVPSTSGGPLDLLSGCDLALRDDGTWFVVNGDSVYRLDFATGVAIALSSEPPLFLVGAVFPDSPASADLYALEVTGSEDMFRYPTTVAPLRGTLIRQRLFPSFNAGRGDLAGPVRPRPNLRPRCLLRNGTGLNPVGFTCATPPQLGSAFTLQVAADANTLQTIVAIAPGGFAPGIVFPTGEGELLLSLVPFPELSTALGTHVFPLPAVPSIAGFRIATQGLRVQNGPGGPRTELQNGLEIVLGL